MIAQYRLHTIVQDPIVWTVFQYLQSFVQKACSEAKDEIPSALKAKIANSEQIQATREEIIAEAEKVLRDLNSESHRYYTFIAEMQNIAQVLERLDFSFESIQSLSDHEVVRSTVGTLRSTFQDKLAQDDDQSPEKIAD